MTEESHNTVTISVYLPEEATDTWRPTTATILGNGLYMLLPTPGYDPEDEVWEFPPGSKVRGEMKDLWVTEKVNGEFTDIIKPVLVAVKPTS